MSGTDQALSVAAIIPVTKITKVGKYVFKIDKGAKVAKKVSKVGKDSKSKVKLPSRYGALNEAKKDAGIIRSQHPESIRRVEMRTAPHEGSVS
ncbi:hypothetical protein [Bacillus sp. NPDC077027]|uniref:hypothetical protein n=1 Tax=Bacillus sp. NPDC077027 TaxID=3390548 RepID=UPI003D05654F